MFFVLKTDPQGLPTWAKRFNYNGGFRFIRELPSGDLLAGFDLEGAGACVARMDADGNFIWCNSYMRPWGRMHDAIIESDTTFVITGYAGTASQPKLFMMKLDEMGEVQWCRGYDSAPHPWYIYQWSQIEKSLDGNYVVLTTLGQQGNSYYQFRPLLMKTDTNGDILWTRSVGAGNYTYFGRDLLVHSDGGYMFSGIVYGDLPEMWTGAPYIFKTDSLGHFACSERVHPVQLMELFPTDSSFTLTSTDGATAHTAFVNDTTFAPISVYDACDVLNGLAPTIDRQGARMTIRPNPNTGRFTMEFPDPLMAESYYSVYDVMGHLLYQRPLPSGRQTEEIDLTRFGAGTYVLKLTDLEGACFERVVVE
ncbi:MAG: T9SS type A sorting domain-containing protein [Flavobacteriales bacterium]